MRPKCEHCDKPQVAKGLCGTHRYRAEKGLPMDKPIGGLKEKKHCFIPGCTNMARLDMCEFHYRKLWEWGHAYFALPDYCEVCGSTERLHVDHDHSCCLAPPTCGECVRGRLCADCNWVLGRVNDNPYRLQELADYLERNGSTVR